MTSSKQSTAEDIAWAKRMRVEVRTDDDLRVLASSDPDTLVRCSKTASLGIGLRLAAVDVFYLIPDKERAFREIVSAYNTGDPVMQEAALDAMFELGTHEAQDFIQKATSSEDELVAETATELLDSSSAWQRS